MFGYAGPPVETSGTGVLVVSISHNIAHHHWLVHHWLAHHWLAHHWLAHHWLVHHWRLALNLVSCLLGWESGQREMGELWLVGSSVGRQYWVGITWLRQGLLRRPDILHKVFVLVCLSSG